MLDKLKLALRVSGAAFDGELQDLIAACLADLGLVGVENLDQADPLVIRAVILYGKANFGFREDSERYKRAYNDIKCALSLAGEYMNVG